MTAFTAATAFLLAACQPLVDDAKAGDPTAAPPPPQVQVAPVVQRTTDIDHVQIARIEPAQRVEIRPRVAGQIDAVLYKEGDVVAAGQALFRLDRRPFEIALESARAQLRVAQAREVLARRFLDRARELVQASAIATETVERRQATHAETHAAVQVAQAAVDAAQLNLDYATVRAPVPGRVGRVLLTAGNQVSAGATQAPLAVLVSTDLDVHLDVPLATLQQGAPDGGRVTAWQARLLADDGHTSLATLPVGFIDNEVDAATGTVRLRARIGKGTANRSAGQYIRVGLKSNRSTTSLWMPDKAVGTDQGRHYALVVTPNDTVDYRAVEIGPLRDGLRQVTQGLREGEHVITEGLMRVRPGVKVQAQPAPAGEMPQAKAKPTAASTRS